MSRTNTCFAFLFCMGLMLVVCCNSPNEYPAVSRHARSAGFIEATSGHAGTHVNAVRIGRQVWLAENLATDTFRNGDPIPAANTREEWIRASDDKTPAWCSVDHNPGNDSIFGKLYNWYAVSDPRGLAPEGWRIPGDQDWTGLTTFLGGEHTSAKELKSAQGWFQGGNGSNSSGFSALPGGYHMYMGSAKARTYYGYWWSPTEYKPYNAWRRHMTFYSDKVFRSVANKYTGLSVRCIRNE